MSASLEQEVDSASDLPDPRQTIAAIGQHLRRVRLASGLKLADLAAKLKVPEKKLTAMENGVLEPFNLAYTRAMLRGYAKIIHTDIDTELAKLGPVPEPSQLKPRSDSLRAKDRHKVFVSPWFKVFCLLFISILVSCAAYLGWRSGYLSWRVSLFLSPAEQLTANATEGNPAQGTDLALETPAGAIAPPSEILPPPPVLLSIKFLAPSWYEVKDVRDKVLATGLETPGAIKRLKLIPPVKLTLGNAAGASIEFRNQPVHIPSTESGVARLVLE
jgi:cytoskeletal protein RodZ